VANDGVWRDDKRLPLAALYDAMAVYAFDGQVDDVTGGDAGAELEFGDELRGEPDPDTPGDPDPCSEQGRRLRPSPDGRIGPH
jgi:hypothetical protein